jgi:hypothetical protein
VTSPPPTLAVVAELKIYSQLGISAFLVDRFNIHHNFFRISERNRTRYVLFCSIWTILFIPISLITFHTASDPDSFGIIIGNGIL